jgi:hypothetical protein
MNDRKVAIGIGAACAAALVGWGLISLVSTSGAPQRGAMAAAPSTVGLGSSGSELAGVKARKGTRASPRRRTASKRVRVRQATYAPGQDVKPSSLADRRGIPRLP